MARVNYAHGKRQREIANKAKREEKLQRKAERSAQGQGGAEGEPEPEGLETVVAPGEEAGITPGASAEPPAQD